MKKQKQQSNGKKEGDSNDLAYPTYGRGLDPHPQMDTYMLNDKLLEGSTTTGVDGKKEKDIRPKIMSPRRMLYE